MLVLAFMLGYLARATLPLPAVPVNPPSFSNYVPMLVVHVLSVLVVFYFARMYQSRSYLIATHIAMPFPGGMHIDAVEEGLSYRSHKSPDGEVVIMVDSSHQTGMGGDIIARYRKLEEDARKIFQVRSVDYRWSTQDTMPIDRVPYIGQLSDTQDHLYVATGFAKWGMTNGTTAAMVIADLINGKENEFVNLFNPLRFM